MRKLALLALTLTGAACGSREPLQPAPGQSMPLAPAASRSVPTTDQLLTPTTIARPDRVDEQLRRSEPLEDDRFDLPPSDVPAGVATIPVSPPEPD